LWNRDDSSFNPMPSLILKRAAASRSSGEWNDDDFDVLTDGAVVSRDLQGKRRAGGFAVDVDARLRPPRRSNADARLCRDARGGDGGVREEFSAGDLFVAAKFVWHPPPSPLGC
jgi:hypothetical protein